MAKNNFNGEVLHFGAVRYRVTGDGALQSTLSDLDDIHSSDLVNVTMASTTSREPSLLANFLAQRARLTITTTEIDETFTISKIVIFVKPVATGYPQ